MADLPEYITALKAALAASERRTDLAEIERDEALADAANAKAKASGVEALVAHVEAQLKLFDAWYGEWSRLPGAVQAFKG